MIDIIFLFWIWWFDIISIILLMFLDGWFKE